MHQDAPTNLFRRLAGRYLGAVLLFSFLSVLALGISRLEYFRPSDQVFQPHFFNQLLGLHRLLFHFFVLVPLLSVVIGFAALASGRKPVQSPVFPRMARAAYYCFLLGGLLVVWEFLWGRLETGWVFALSYGMTQELVSLPMLVALGLGCSAMLMNGIVLAATVWRGGLEKATPFEKSLFWVGLSGGAGMVCLAAAAFLGLTGAGDGGALVYLYAFAEMPIRLWVLLPALGVAAAVLGGSEVQKEGKGIPVLDVYFGAIALLGLLGVDLRGVPETQAGFLMTALFGSLFRLLLVLPIGAFCVHFMIRAIRQGSWCAERLYALGLLLLLLVAVPLDVFLSLPVNRFYAASYLDTSLYYLLLGGAAFTGFMAAMHRRDPSLPVDPGRNVLSQALGFMVLASSAATFIPMIILGLKGISMDLSIYPSYLLPLQVMSTAGGTLLLGSMSVAIVLLLAQRRKGTLKAS